MHVVAVTKGLFNMRTRVSAINGATIAPSIRTIAHPDVTPSVLIDGPSPVSNKVLAVLVW